VVRGYLEAFRREIQGCPAPGAITTRDVITASRTALAVQLAGEKSGCQNVDQKSP
jgi:hypothetical protein